MSDTVKLIIEIPKKDYEAFKELIAINIGGRCSGKGLIYRCLTAVKNGTPLDDIDSDETRAYFDGQAYGWEEGRKALIADVKAEVEKKCDRINSIASVLRYPQHREIQELLCEILESIDKGDSE